MSQRLPLAWAVMGLLLSSPAWLRAAEESPEAILKSKGLSKSGGAFVLADEVKLGKLFIGVKSETSRKKKEVLDAQQAMKAAETATANKNREFREARWEYDQLQQRTAGTAVVPSQVVARINFLVARLNAMQSKGGEMELAEKALQAQRASTGQRREEFIKYVIDLKKRFDALEARYKELAADAAVEKALADLNQTSSTKYALGPARPFVSTAVKAMKALSAEVISDSIPMHQGRGRLWNVAVTINNQPAQLMAIDTGASLVSLPWKMAQSLNITPTSQSRKIKLTLADGRTIDGWEVMADSVRVGRFTVEKCGCAVLSEEAIEAEPLLGLTFLGRFTFKLDTERALLVISSVGEGGGKTPGKASEPVAAAKPESAPSEPAQVPTTAKERADQMARLLEPDNEADKQVPGPVFRMGKDKKLTFHASKRGPVESLRKRYGDPDEMRKIPGPPADPGAPEPPPWKLWTWGRVAVIADDTGTTRYFAVMESE